MGSSYNAEYVQATQYQADKNAEIARDSNEADMDIAQVQSDAVIQQAKYDYEARIFEAQKNYEVQMEALRVREKEAELQFKVDWKNAENDAIRAEASYLSAESKVIEAESESKEVDYEHEEKLSDSASSGDLNYWYG